MSDICFELESLSKKPFYDTICDIDQVVHFITMPIPISPVMGTVKNDSSNGCCTQLHDAFFNIYVYIYIYIYISQSFSVRDVSRVYRRQNISLPSSLFLAADEISCFADDLSGFTAV